MSLPLVCYAFLDTVHSRRYVDTASYLADEAVSHPAERPDSRVEQPDPRVEHEANNLLGGAKAGAMLSTRSTDSDFGTGSPNTTSSEVMKPDAFRKESRVQNDEHHQDESR
jgi:hypothetical protein